MQETQETWVGSLGWEDPLEKGMTTHSSILAWRIPWKEEPGRLHRVANGRTQLITHACFSCSLVNILFFTHIKYSEALVQALASLRPQQMMFPFPAHLNHRALCLLSVTSLSAGLPSTSLWL